MSDEHPELKKMQENIDLSSIGAMGLGILKGALSEGATLKEAIAVTGAWFSAAMNAPEDNTKEEE